MTQVALVFVLAGAAAAAEPEKPALPSVLLVTLDTTRADHLGCYGAEFAATPNLDGLARQGVRFERAISPAPLTLPAHASIFTGLAPRRHAVRNNTQFRLGQDPEVLAERLRDHGYQTAAFVSSVVLDRLTGLDRGFEYYDDTVRVGSRKAFNYEERAASQTNDTVLEHMDRLEGPFFVWVHYFDPHLPYVPPPPYDGRFPDRPYDGEIAFMDDQLGRLLKAARKKSSSLIVVVAGDHGESLGEHGEAAHGIFIYEATQRVPLIVAGPGLPAGKVVAEPAGLVDVAPTLLDLLGLPPLTGVDGRSLVPLMRGARAGRRAYELESLFPLYAYGWVPPRGLVRDGYKYIEAPRPELYWLSADPNETTNLVGAKEKLVAKMEAELRGLTAGDVAQPVGDDPGLAEQRRRLESLGYLTGGGSGEPGETIDPKDGVTWIEDLETGRRAYQTGKPSEGIAPLRRLLSRNPRNVPALLALAMCYLGDGQAERAVEATRRAVEIGPDDDLVRFNLANALSSAGATNPDALNEAPTQYERALELNPRFADAYLNYAAFLERGDSAADALALLERARGYGVRDPDVEIRIAVLELERGNVEAAKAAFGRSLELHPGGAGPLEALARINERQGRFAEAAAYYQRLLRVAPSAGAALALGSIRLERLGDREGARRAFEQGLSRAAPGDPLRDVLRERIAESSKPN